jgi:hypothetical protein
VDALAKLVFKALEGVANDFECRPTGRFGSFAWSIMHELYPSIGDQSNGCDPLQQSVARMLVEKVNENMTGWYPPISKIMFDYFSNYASERINPKSAFGLLQEAFYVELLKFASLYDEDHERALAFLPNCARYDRATNSLIHRYFSGNEITTKLDDLQLQPTSFEDDAVRAYPS